MNFKLVPTNKIKYKYSYFISRKYKFGGKQDAYFISFATIYFIEVFTKDDFFGCISEYLDYCRNNKVCRFMANILCQDIYLFLRFQINIPLDTLFNYARITIYSG